MCSIEPLIERSEHHPTDSVGRSSFDGVRPLPPEVSMSSITLAPVRVERARPAASRRVASARPRQVRRGQVRLTRRGRLVVVGFVLAVASAVAVFLAAGSAATGEEGAPGQIDVVTVAPGETLWGIASDVAAESGDDVRDVMQQIRDLNTIDGGTLFAGQDLRVPAH
jgi:hypothetical protein